MYNVYNGQGEVIDTADTQVEAFRLVDYNFRTDHTNGPFYCAPQKAPQEAPVEAPVKRSFFRRLVSAA